MRSSQVTRPERFFLPQFRFNNAGIKGSLSGHLSDSIPARSPRPEGIVQDHIYESEDDGGVDGIKVPGKGDGFTEVLEVAALCHLSCTGDDGIDAALGDKAGHAAGSLCRLQGIDIHRHAAIALVGIAQHFLFAGQALSSGLLQDLPVKALQLGDEAGLDDIGEIPATGGEVHRLQNHPQFDRLTIAEAALPALALYIDLTFTEPGLAEHKSEYGL